MVIHRLSDLVQADDCWAVGRDNHDHERYDTLVMHWDGESWGRVDSPNPGGVDNDGDPLRYHSLYDVDCVSAGDCWGVGYSSSRPGALDPDNPVPLIVHWDGRSWSTVPAAGNDIARLDWPYRFDDVPRVDALFGINCVGTGDCWAVGHYAATTNHNTLVEHWDGQSWRLVPSATTDDKLHEVNIDRLYDVSCVGAGDCWTIGNRVRGDTLATLTLRTAGLAFTADSPTSGIGGQQVTVTAQTRHLPPGTEVTFRLGGRHPNRRDGRDRAGPRHLHPARGARHLPAHRHARRRVLTRRKPASHQLLHGGQPRRHRVPGTRQPPCHRAVHGGEGLMAVIAAVVTVSMMALSDGAHYRGCGSRTRSSAPAG